MKIQDVKKKYEEKLLKKANVVGVMTAYKIKEGWKTEELSISCMVEKKVPLKQLKRKDRVPSKIKGIVTDVIEVGKIDALAIDKKAKHRPCPMGTSGGHPRVTAGTNGELLRDKKEGKICIGTNNHVAANSNDAKIGDPYLQPGVYDGGKDPADVIGKLLRFVPIKFFDGGDGNGGGGCPLARFVAWVCNAIAWTLGRKSRLRVTSKAVEYNVVDGAIVEVNKEDVSAEIVGVGIPNGVTQAKMDTFVQKSGRTTCHQVNGRVVAIDGTLAINYGGGKVAYYKDQIMISRVGFCAGGDSGSLVLDMNGYAVGKLFAGGKDITVACPIYPYLELLDAEVITK